MLAKRLDLGRIYGIPSALAEGRASEQELFWQKTDSRALLCINGERTDKIEISLLTCV